MATPRLLTAWAVLILLAAPTLAQKPPGLLPRNLESPEPPRAEPETKLDGNVVPAAARQEQPISVPASVAPAVYPPANAPLLQLPTPAVSVAIRGPGEAHKGREVRYSVMVSNSSAADAFDVFLTCKLPEAALSGTYVPAGDEDAKPEPLPIDGKIKIGTMRTGARRQYDIVLKPKEDADKLALLAKITFEHGVVLRTKFNNPREGLKVSHKVLVDRAVRDVPFACRIEVTNTGRVGYTDVIVTETLKPGLELDLSTPPSPKPDFKKDNTVLSWKIPALRSGETRAFEYTLVARAATANDRASGRYQIDAHGATQGEDWDVPADEARFKVEVTGPTESKVMIQSPALYQVSVQNTGTAELKNVLVNCRLPRDVQATKASGGSQQFPDAVQWVVPRLKPNEEKVVKLYLTSNREGAQSMDFSVRANPKQDFQKTIQTVFYGAPTLNWKSSGDGHVAVGGDVSYTITVENGGNGPAKKVTVGVELPPEVEFLGQASPTFQSTKSSINFGPLEIAAGATTTFTFKAKAKAGGEAVFKFFLRADHFDQQEPLRQEKVTIITGR